MDMIPIDDAADIADFIVKITSVMEVKGEGALKQSSA